MLRLKWRHVKNDNEYRAQCGSYRLTVFLMRSNTWLSEVARDGDVWEHEKNAQLPMTAMYRAERLLLRLVRAEQRRLAKIELVLTKPQYITK